MIKHITRPYIIILIITALFLFKYTYNVTNNADITFHIQQFSEILGNNTHKPPKGSDCKKISDHDANGDKKEQWHVRSKQRHKISEKERMQNQKEITPYPKHQAFIDAHQDKYD